MFGSTYEDEIKLDAMQNVWLQNRRTSSFELEEIFTSQVSLVNVCIPFMSALFACTMYHLQTAINDNILYSTTVWNGNRKVYIKKIMVCLFTVFFEHRKCVSKICFVQKILL